MAGMVRPQVQGFVSKSKVVGEFVDGIPEVKKKSTFEKYRTSWEAQPGVKEALSKAFNNPGRAMELLDYTEGALSVRRKNAKLRVMSLVERQGYSEDNGWTIRAVDTKIYCLYHGAR
jgi:hypothetical protein